MTSGPGGAERDAGGEAEAGGSTAGADAAAADGPGLTPLSAQDEAVLALERRSWPGPGAKERAYASSLGISPDPLLPAAERPAGRPARPRARPGDRQPAAPRTGRPPRPPLTAAGTHRPPPGCPCAPGVRRWSAGRVIGMGSPRTTRHSPHRRRTPCRRRPPPRAAKASPRCWPGPHAPSSLSTSTARSPTSSPTPSRPAPTPAPSPALGRARAPAARRRGDHRPPGRRRGPPRRLRATLPAWNTSSSSGTTAPSAGRPPPAPSSAPPPHPGVAAVRAELPAVLEGTGVWHGPWVETASSQGRPGARRPHPPRRGPAGRPRRAARPADRRSPTRHGLIVEPGRLVLELRPPGMDKGVALADWVRETGAETVVYAGDDLGDLAAFAAVEKLRAEGLPGVLVCSGNDEVTELAERADLVRGRPGRCRRAARRARRTGWPPAERAGAPARAAPRALRLERPQLVEEPPGRRQRRGRGGQPLGALGPLLAVHRQCLVQRLGGGVDVVRVDGQRVLAQLRVGARLPRKHQRAALVGDHRDLLGDQVHAVPDRVDEGHVRQPVGGERAREVVLDVQHDRLPARRAELVVDLLGDPAHLGRCSRGRRPGPGARGRRRRCARPARATPDGRPAARRYASRPRTMFLDSSVRSTRTTVRRSPRRSARAAPQPLVDVGAVRPLAQEVRVRAEAVHADRGRAAASAGAVRRQAPRRRGGAPRSPRRVPSRSSR